MPESNKIIRKTQSPQSPQSPQSCTNQIRRKVKLVRRSVTKLDVNSETVPPPVKIEVEDNIDGLEIIPDYINSNKDLSKEATIEKVEYQKALLNKNRVKYTEKEYELKLTTIDKMLSKLRLGLTFNNLSEMNDTRVKIDKIVLDKKIPVGQFKKKIDLTGDKDNKDPATGILTTSREYFKKVSYLPIPKELAKIDPAKNRNKNFGNQPLPPEMKKLI